MTSGQRSKLSQRGICLSATTSAPGSLIRGPKPGGDGWVGVLEITSRGQQASRWTEPGPAPSCLPLAPPPLRDWSDPAHGFPLLPGQELRDAPTTGQASKTVKGARPGLRRRRVFNSSAVFSERKSRNCICLPVEKSRRSSSHWKPSCGESIQAERQSWEPGAGSLTPEGHRGGLRAWLEAAPWGWEGPRGGDQIPQFSSFCPTSHP